MEVKDCRLVLTCRQSLFYENGRSCDYIHDRFMAKNKEIMRFQKKKEDFML
ncbi:hypothetical protein J31TS3_14340 [Paenibacillus lactis]|nr:hypothetical protein J31TS3_14340 [Paenibacillus lactis]